MRVVTFRSLPQSFPSQTETPHEALLAKLQKTDTSKPCSSSPPWVPSGVLSLSPSLPPLPSASKRTVPDEASKLKDVVLKPKDSGPSLRYTYEDSG